MSRQGTSTKQIWVSFNLFHKQVFKSPYPRAQHSNTDLSYEQDEVLSGMKIRFLVLESDVARASGLLPAAHLEQAWLMMFITEVLYKGGWIGVRVCIQNENCKLKTLSLPEFFFCEALEMITYSLLHNQLFLCQVP